MRDESPLPKPQALRLDEDYYYDGPYLVFTAQYHLKRGSCCNSGCRHCPYVKDGETPPAQKRGPAPPGEES